LVKIYLIFFVGDYMRKRIKDLGHDNKYKVKSNKSSRSKINKQSIMMDGSILQEYYGD
jgi:hypothetical protein